MGIRSVYVCTEVERRVELCVRSYPCGLLVVHSGVELVVVVIVIMFGVVR